MHFVRCALDLALANAGKSIEAKIAMIAITTSNSIKVKPDGRTHTGVWLRRRIGDAAGPNTPSHLDDLLNVIIGLRRNSAIETRTWCYWISKRERHRVCYDWRP